MNIRNESTGDRVARIEQELRREFPGRAINSDTIIMTMQTEYLEEIHQMLRRGNNREYTP